MKTLEPAKNSDWADNKKNLENFVNWPASLFLFFPLIFLSDRADNLKKKYRQLCKLASFSIFVFSLFFWQIGQTIIKV